MAPKLIEEYSTCRRRRRTERASEEPRIFSHILEFRSHPMADGKLASHGERSEKVVFVGTISHCGIIMNLSTRLQPCFNSTILLEHQVFRSERNSVCCKSDFDKLNTRLTIRRVNSYPSYPDILPTFTSSMNPALMSSAICKMICLSTQVSLSNT